MNRERTREVLDKLGIRAEKSDGHGIEIHRVVPVAGASFRITEVWRLYTGGGIAGNSDQVWLSPLHHAMTLNKKRGPYWNKTQLEKALRAWRRGE